MPDSLRSRGTLAACALALLAYACSEALYRDARVSSPDPPTDRPIEVSGDGYVGSERCRACHPAEYASWHRSYHHTMTQEVTPETVLPDFDGTVLDLDGATYRLERRGEEFWVEIEGPGADGEVERRERQIVLATGSHHFQAFWVPTGTGRMIDFFPFCWRIDEGRWMPIDSAFLFPPRESQRTENGRWNRTCNKCHATQGRPALGDDMQTTAAEFGIACEACHGPGAEHLAANSNPARRYRHHAAGRDETIVQPEHLSPRLSAQVCGQCHAITAAASRDEADRWKKEGYSFRPGENLYATRAVRREGDGHFWSDGVIRVSGREYNGLIESPCFTHGVEAKGIMTCLSCHQMHAPTHGEGERGLDEWADDQLLPGMRGDAACTQCHVEYTEPDAVEAHTFHAANSTGSSCYDCHMTYTSWGLLKAMRTHQVTSPSVVESLETGRPNACNQCHLDRTLGWTARHLAERYEIETPALDEEARTVAAALPWLLSGDAGQRALMAWSLGWDAAREASGTDWMAPYLAQLLVDPYDAVRFRAYRSLSTLPGLEGFVYDFEYDFVGPPEEREAARQRALELWRAQGRPDSAGNAALLLDADGRLQRDAFQRLLMRRDDRPVALLE